VQFALVDDGALGYTFVFIGLALLGAMLIRDWVIGRREEAADVQSDPPS
jgi:hypothetical protein